MRYLTAKWYDLCQKIDLGSHLRVHRGADQLDEALYARLYKRKEKEHLTIQREIYDTDPRFMLERDGSTLVRLDVFLSEETPAQEDTMVYEMPPEQKAHIEQLIAAFDARPPFDEEHSRQEFRSIHALHVTVAQRTLPPELRAEIADLRVYALGYCTKEIKRRLVAQGKKNEREMRRILNEYALAQQAEPIPQEIRNLFRFHDCRVVSMQAAGGAEPGLIIHLNTDGGFTNLNRLTLVDGEIIHQTGEIEDSSWLYKELYRYEEGYELHVLLSGGKGMVELTVRCREIVAEQV
ncbi:DUF4085 family protein [Paenibacillus sp. SYP-B4298]|uniref:DUF4085 family protein n=1 Tax=Paenibacillus sp. SYP-B4298 TaxID=2996034 RepID=UPI0022DE2311|nr:DUF4085 family protein [Paenibacillus sp. SYP-B4298]